MKRLKGWKINFKADSTEGYCWEKNKVIDIGLKNSNPIRLLLHEVAHIGINPFGNKHTQGWFDEYSKLMSKYMSTVELSKSDKLIVKVYNLKKTNPLHKPKKEIRKG